VVADGRQRLVGHEQDLVVRYNTRAKGVARFPRIALAIAESTATTSGRTVVHRVATRRCAE